MKKFLFHTFYYFLPVFLWSMLIFSFSSHPTGVVTTVHWQDVFVKKTAHVAEYAIFAGLMYRSLINSYFSKKQSLIISLIVAVIYAFTDEFHQSFTPTREPHIRDVIFDTIGASTSLILIWKYLPKAPRKLKQLAETLELV